LLSFVPGSLLFEKFQIQDVLCPSVILRVFVDLESTSLCASFWQLLFSRILFCWSHCLEPPSGKTFFLPPLPRGSIFSKMSGSSFFGDMHILYMRGGERSESCFGSSLREPPSPVENVRRNAFRQTSCNPWPFPQAGLRDYRVDLTDFGYWASVIVMLAKCDLSPLILARVVAITSSSEGGEFVFYKAMMNFPSIHMVGSMDLFSNFAHPTSTPCSSST
jgi:hypothetical protein